MNSIFYVVGYCPSCGTGPLGVRICGGCGSGWVQCEECDALWSDPDTSEQPTFLEQPELPCPQCSQSLWELPSHWASFEEIEQLGWQDQIVAQGVSMADRTTAWGAVEPPAWFEPVSEVDHASEDGSNTDGASESSECGAQEGDTQAKDTTPPGPALDAQKPQGRNDSDASLADDKKQKPPSDRRDKRGS